MLLFKHLRRACPNIMMLIVFSNAFSFLKANRDWDEGSYEKFGIATYQRATERYHTVTFLWQASSCDFLCNFVDPCKGLCGHRVRE